MLLTQQQQFFHGTFASPLAAGHDSYPRGVPDAPPGVPVEPWTGFTIWNATLPAPEALIAHLKRRGLRVMFNLHPHFGLQFYDEACVCGVCSAGGVA